jgi:hypothetical protein
MIRGRVIDAPSLKRFQDKLGAEPAQQTDAGHVTAQPLKLPDKIANQV